MLKKWKLQTSKSPSFEAAATESSLVSGPFRVRLGVSHGEANDRQEKQTEELHHDELVLSKHLKNICYLRKCDFEIVFPWCYSLFYYNQKWFCHILNIWKFLTSLENVLFLSYNLKVIFEQLIYIRTKNTTLKYDLKVPTKSTNKSTNGRKKLVALLFRGEDFEKEHMIRIGLTFQRRVSFKKDTTKSNQLVFIASIT